MPHKNPTAARRGRPYPLKSVPFPKDTVVVRSPELRPRMTVQEANDSWEAWRRIVGRLTQFRS